MYQLAAAIGIFHYILPTLLHKYLFSAIVSMDKALFRRRLLNFMIAMPIISVVNNVLKYSIGALKIDLRTNMTRRLYDEYLKNHTYYRMANLDNRISNADQLLTTDVDKFCESVADLYCNVAKPVLDIGIYVYRLTTSLGGGTPGLMLGYLFVSGKPLDCICIAILKI